MWFCCCCPSAKKNNEDDVSLDLDEKGKSRVEYIEKEAEPQLVEKENSNEESEIQVGNGTQVGMMSKDEKNEVSAVKKENETSTSLQDSGKDSSEKIFKCKNGCGFAGTFEEVRIHEATVGACSEFRSKENVGKVNAQADLSGLSGLEKLRQQLTEGRKEEAENSKLIGMIGPRWTRGEIEAPQGEKNMGTWTSRVYTKEQQERLNVDEMGNPRM
eukprot:g3483.t1